jgi:PKD repeat protein
MRLFLLICTVLATGQIKAQYQDYIWLLGQNSQTDIEHAGMILDFFDDTLTIHSEFRDIYFLQVNASMSDSGGNIILSTNGLRVYNHLNEVMENSDTLNPGYFYDLYQDRGYILIQGAITLAQPENDSIYFIFHMDVDVNQDFTDAYSNNLYATEVHPYFNNGQGRVVAKNQVLIDERMDKGKMTAVRSGNGRDWWIIVRDHSSNLYHKLFFTTNGEITLTSQEVGDSIPSSVGQAVFSPDGTKYVQVDLHGYQGDPVYVNIYDFDRCSGELYNPIQFTYADSAVCLGAAISPNSRFLYVSSWLHVYQYDLWADDIEASGITVAEWDGFADLDIFSNTFYLAQLAPNGKIYINSNNGTKHLHVINQPDSLGLACDVCQHCVELPSWNSSSMPNFPNYRLGHEEGSPCDTLRQPPTAAWAYESDLLQVAFQNQSTHDIRSYAWAFGDGATDTVAHPSHTYALPGGYEVCLQVTNPRGVDTYCETIQVYTTNVGTISTNDLRLSVQPNPVTDGQIRVQFPAGGRELTLFDGLGRSIRQWSLGSLEVQRNLEVSGLPQGVYLLKWTSKDGKQMLVEKVVVE